jgi:hypothetical protein
VVIGGMTLENCKPLVQRGSEMVAAISSVYFEKIRKRQHGRLRHCSEIFRIALTALFKQKHGSPRGVPCFLF